MAAATDALENGLLQLILHNVNLAGIGDSTGLRGSTAAGNLYVSLHTADPGEAGTQSTSEATYTGYARVAVARSSAGWTITDANFTNAGTVQFPAATGGSSTVTHIGIGTAASGAGKLLLRSALSNPASVAITTGIALKLDPGAINGSVA